MIIRSSGLPVAVIFDIDRTLADVSHLEHLFDEPNAADNHFEAFHEAAVNAPVIQWVADEVHRSKTLGVGAIAVSARPESARPHTMAWLESVDLHMDDVYLRPDLWMGLTAVDAKQSMLPRIRRNWDVIHAYEDKPEIAAMFRLEGIPTTLVEPAPAT